MIIVKNVVFPLPMKTKIKYIEVLTINYDNWLRNIDNDII